MKNQFKVSYYLRSNYENKEGKSPIENVARKTGSNYCVYH
ncbi:hypothetical protein IX332_001908 [Porphyromonas levii]|nr:hypothetical protein [Porphyromonas levii]